MTIGSDSGAGVGDDSWASQMVATTIMRCFKGRDAKELFYDLGVFILVAFVTKLLESFREIVVVRDWMTFLMRC
jgi:hypothetical protein